MPSTLEGGWIPGLRDLIMLRTAVKYLAPDSKDIKEQVDSERAQSSHRLKQGNPKARKIHERT